jgi:3-dehydroquinate dehydratase II
MQIWIINGPNLNLLGRREPEIYGSETFDAFFEKLKKTFPTVDLHYFHSNHEGFLIDKLQEIGFSANGIVLNAGGLTHTSIALADAISSIQTPVVEVHISNVHARESFRQHSFLSAKCTGVLVGFGLDGYRMAVDFLAKK